VVKPTPKPTFKPIRFPTDPDQCKPHKGNSGHLKKCQRDKHDDHDKGHRDHDDRDRPPRDRDKEQHHDRDNDRDKDGDKSHDKHRDKDGD
jgi:hypothetical protein